MYSQIWNWDDNCLPLEFIQRNWAHRHRFNLLYIFMSQLLLYLQKPSTNVLSSAPSFTSAIVPKASPAVIATFHTAAFSTNNEGWSFCLLSAPLKQITGSRGLSMTQANTNNDSVTARWQDIHHTIELRAMSQNETPAGRAVFVIWMTFYFA